MDKPTEEVAEGTDPFMEGIQALAQGVRIEVQGDAPDPKLQSFLSDLKDELDALGTALYRLEVVRKDRTALAESIQDAATVRRFHENRVGQLVAAYTSRVAELEAKQS